jgi:hypothetical protein
MEEVFAVRLRDRQEMGKKLVEAEEQCVCLRTEPDKAKNKLNKTERAQRDEGLTQQDEGRVTRDGEQALRDGHRARGDEARAPQDGERAPRDVG